ncbi:MAG: 3-phosphoshikimate 1-carboxyvinyltransferase [Pseudomonadota bacterium]
MQVLSLPGSKSIINRALICAALAKGTTCLTNVNFCDDVQGMLENLVRLGIKIRIGIKRKEVFVFGGGLRQTNKVISTGEAGTTTRFIIALAHLIAGKTKINCKGHMKNRPVYAILEALSKIQNSKFKIQNDTFPININSNGYINGSITINSSISSQFLSAILLISPYCENQITINVKGKITSKPYIDMTLKVMQDFGVKVENRNYRKYIIKKQMYRSKNKYIIEPDASAASYFLAYSVQRTAYGVRGNGLKINGLGTESNQGDVQFINVLKKMGAITECGKTYLKIKPSKLKGITVDMNKMPDLVQTLAVLALFAQGTTYIKNVYNLRLKETDRLQALENELLKFGDCVETGRDWIKVKGIQNSKFKIQNYERAQGNMGTGEQGLGIKSKINIETYNDHRMAMSFGILEKIFPDKIYVKNKKCVNKSFPGFWELLDKLK